MKTLLAIVLTFFVSSAFAATATLTDPVKDCRIAYMNQDAVGNVLFTCTGSKKIGVPVYVHLDEFDHNAGATPTITGGTCTYTSITLINMSLSGAVYINVQCAEVFPQITKTPPENINNASVVILPDGTWGWRTSVNQ